MGRQAGLRRVRRGVLDDAAAALHEVWHRIGGRLIEGSELLAKFRIHLRDLLVRELQ